MVRALLIVTLLIAPATLVAQSFSFGFRMNMAVGWSASTSGTRDYFSFNSAGGTGRKRIYGTVAMDMKDRPQFAYTPELFAKFQFKRNFFLQGGIGSMYYHLPYDVEESSELTSSAGGSPVKSVMGSGNNTFLVPYATLGYILWPKSTIQPYVTLGGSARILARDSEISEDTPDYIRDIDRPTKTIFNARLGLGLKYYSLHLEAVYQSNISSLGPFVTRVSTFHVGLGLGLFSFSTVKKRTL